MESIYNAIAGAFSSPHLRLVTSSQVASSQSQTETDEIEQSDLPVLTRQKRATKKRKVSEDGQIQTKQRKKKRAVEEENELEVMPFDQPQQLPFQPIDTLEKQVELNRKRNRPDANEPFSSQLIPPPSAPSAPATPIAAGSTKPKKSQRAPSPASCIQSASTSAPVPVQNELPTMMKERHLELLATKWLNTRALKKLVDEEGIEFKTGVFSKLEARQMDNRIAEYKREYNLTDEEISSIIFTKGKGQRKEHAGFMAEIARSVPGRPLNNVFQYLRRKYHPLKAKGTWSAEEDAELKAAYKEYGPQWQKISASVDRSDVDCRDRYRNFIDGEQERGHGHWSKEEEETLTRVVQEVAAIQGKAMSDTYSGVFWTTVAARMGHKRSRGQCRIKWTDVLLPRWLQNGAQVRWTQAHIKTLVERARAQNARDISEVDFKRIVTPDFNAFSDHTLQKKLHALVREIIGNEGEDFNDVLDRILDAHERHSQSRESTAAPSSVGRFKSQPPSSMGRFKSQPFIESVESDDDDNLSHFGAMQSGRRSYPSPRTHTQGVESMSPEVVDTSGLPRQRGASIRGSVPPTPKANGNKSRLEQILQVASSSNHRMAENEESAGLQGPLTNGHVEQPSTTDGPHVSSTEKKKKRKSVDHANGLEVMASDQPKKKKHRKEGANVVNGAGASNEPAMVEATTDTPNKKKKHRKENADASVPAAVATTDLPVESPVATSEKKKSKKRKSDATIPANASTLLSGNAHPNAPKSTVPSTTADTSETPRNHKKKKSHHGAET